MAGINEIPRFTCSESVQKMRGELSDGPVTAYDMVACLLDMHPEYADGRAAELRLAQDAQAPQRSVDDWLNDVSELYEDKEQPLDGRLVILGLALMIRDLQRSLHQDDFIMILMFEQEPRYKSLLAPAARDLYYELRGRPRMEESGSPFESLGGDPAAIDDVFESVGSLPQSTAGIDEPQEMVSAVGPAGEADFEAVGGGETAETPQSGGAKGIPPQSPQETAGPQETPLRQARRLEAAMPESVRVKETTELLVMLPRAQSEGLRAELPKETVGGEIIDKDDVEERDADLVFAAPDKPLTVFFTVEAMEKDFEIAKPVRKVKIYADRDGDYQIFNLMPLRVTNRAPLQAILYRDEELTDAVSTVRLFTRIEPPDVADGSDSQLATLTRALTYATVPVNLTIAGDLISVGDISDSSGVAVGGGASANVSRTTAVFAFDNITPLFTPLLSLVSSSAPQDQIGLVIGHIQALQIEIERGPDASDPQIANLLHLIAEAVPLSGTAILELFIHPEVNTAAGNATRFVLGQIEQGA